MVQLMQDAMYCLIARKTNITRIITFTQRTMFAQKHSEKTMRAVKVLVGGIPGNVALM